MPLCIVKNCKNRTKSRPVLGQGKDKNVNNLSYHRFPKDKKLKSLWLDVLKLNTDTVPVEARICSVHFTDDAYNVLHGRKRLRPNALPRIEPVAVDASNGSNAPNASNIVTNSIHRTSKIDRATSPILGHSASNDVEISKNSVPNILTVDRATSPIPGCSQLVHQPASSSLAEEYLRKQLQDTKNCYLKKIKHLQQKVRRKESRVNYLKTILDASNILSKEELRMLQDDI